MNLADISSNIPAIVLAVGLILLQLFLRRRRKPEITHQEIARSLLSEVKLNQALAESYPMRQKPKKFETVSWQRNKNRLDFLDQGLQASLNGAFSTTAEDFNQQIEAAKKYKSASYMVNVNMAKIKEPLTKSQQGLEQWLMDKTGTKEPPTKYPGMFDGWFGKS